MSEIAAANIFNDLFCRLRLSLACVAAQFWATLLIILAGVAWTRLPDSYAWQVALALFVPLVLLAAVLLLEAATMRRLFNEKQRQVNLVVGVLTLLVWVAVVWAAWALLDWCSDQVPVWAGYLNSRASAGSRATLFTYDHIQNWFTFLVWIIPLDRCARESDSLGHGVGPMGIAIAGAKNHSSAVQLALVAGSDHRSSCGCRVAKSFF